MITIRIDLTQATKAEYDTYVASPLRQYVITDLARDFTNCEVVVELSGGPHAVERLPNLEQRKCLFDPDPLIDPQVVQVIAEYRRAYIAAHRRNWLHRALCRLGSEEALRCEALVQQTRAQAVAFAGQSTVHKMALERIVRSNPLVAKRDGIGSILTESNKLP